MLANSSLSLFRARLLESQLAAARFASFTEAMEVAVTERKELGSQDPIFIHEVESNEDAIDFASRLSQQGIAASAEMEPTIHVRVDLTSLLMEASIKEKDPIEDKLELKTKIYPALFSPEDEEENDEPSIPPSSAPVNASSQKKQIRTNLFGMDPGIALYLWLGMSSFAGVIAPSRYELIYKSGAAEKQILSCIFSIIGWAALGDLIGTGLCIKFSSAT